MKSFKPGRGPSQQGVVGGVAASVFGVFWCIVAVSMGAVFMVPFGLIFIGISVYNAYYNYHNLTSEDRYSIIDIVDENEESDPLNMKYGRQYKEMHFDDSEVLESVEFCPYCGKQISSDFEFCPKCGKQLSR